MAELIFAMIDSFDPTIHSFIASTTSITPSSEWIDALIQSSKAMFEFDQGKGHIVRSFDNIARPADSPIYPLGRYGA